MTNEKVEIKNEEEVTESRFTKHFNKHKSAYFTAAGAGVAMLGMKLGMERKMGIMVNEAFRLGVQAEAESTWTKLTDHVKGGLLNMELIGETDDEVIKHNMAKLKELVSGGE